MYSGVGVPFQPSGASSSAGKSSKEKKGPGEDDEEEEEDDNEAKGIDAWERAYADERSWEDLQEDESGLLRPIDTKTLVHAQYRKRLLLRSSAGGSVVSRIQKGLIRYLYVVIDLSRAASETDYRSSRMAVVAKQAEAFIREFFDQNPLSHVGLIIIKEGLAHRLTDIGGSPEAQIKALMGKLECSGEASLQNALELVHGYLSQIPSYGHREVLILYSALNTCDPGDIMETVQRCKKAKIRCSVIGLSAEVFICKHLCEETGGTYTVALNEKFQHKQTRIFFRTLSPSWQSPLVVDPAEPSQVQAVLSSWLGDGQNNASYRRISVPNKSHFKELLLEHAPPPPAIAEYAAANLIKMGFPQRGAEGVVSICSCHKEAKVGGGYTCPRCKVRVCELPTECRTCGLTLVSSPHLARSYHHLFPVAPFDEVPPHGRPGQRLPTACFGCQLSLIGQGVQPILRVSCPKCNQHFCLDCDIYIHESLHNCPGCESQRISAV